jgi:hypothetical protein
MVRTTVMAPEALYLRLRQIAKDEGIPLAEVIRQGLEWRADQARVGYRFSFTGIGDSAGLPPIDWEADDLEAYAFGDDQINAPVTPKPSDDEIAHFRALADQRAKERGADPV